jgi:hypothetical protein
LRNIKIENLDEATENLLSQQIRVAQVFSQNELIPPCLPILVKFVSHVFNSLPQNSIWPKEE